MSVGLPALCEADLLPGWSTPAPLSAQPAGIHAVRFYVDASLSANTKRAYLGDLEALARWGAKPPVDEQTLAAYLAHEAGRLSPNTLARRLCALRMFHRSHGYVDPTAHPLVHQTLAGIRRIHGTARRPARPVSLDEICRMSSSMSGNSETRDRAVLLLGFRAALRRSELTALDVEDLTFSEQGLLLRIRRSKVDQNAQGRIVAVPAVDTGTCAVHALRSWLSCSNVEVGAVFRSIDRYGRLKTRLSGQTVCQIIKRWARVANVDACSLSAHSLRVGFVTAAVDIGAPLDAIQRQTGHKSMATVFRYARTSGSPFRRNANEGIV